jgi:hypothetical protein
LREVKKDIKVTQNYDVRIYEDDLVIISELPQPKLAIVVLIVRVFFSSRVSDSFDESDLPPGCCKSMTFGFRDGII